jgi:hypothetical protein
VFFDEQSEDALIDAIARLEQLPLDPADIVLHARQFNPARFEHQMREAIAEAWTQVHGQPMPATDPAAGEGGAVLSSHRKPAYA